MKDSLFEMLLSLFEKTLSQLKETRLIENESTAPENILDFFSGSANVELKLEVLKQADAQSTRVLTNDERNKLTKPSYQFLMRLFNLGVINAADLEKVLNYSIFSESRMVGLQEIKWIVRNHFSRTVNAEQLAFLDLVLYQKEDGHPLH
jgi:uncharacterized protein Smg (DUF494 family)